MFSEKKAHRNYPICKIFSSRLCTSIYCFSIYFNQFLKISSYCYVVFTFQVKTLRLSASLRYPYFMSSLKWIVLFRFQWDLHVKNFRDELFVMFSLEVSIMHWNSFESLEFWYCIVTFFNILIYFCNYFKSCGDNLFFEKIFL